MRRTKGEETIFRCADGVLFRALLLPRRRVSETWQGVARDRPAETDAELAELRNHLVEMIADERFREALEVSSTSLAHTIDAVLANEPVTASDMRKAHRAVTRYLLRAVSRPTPFGLLAGVLWGSFRAATKGELSGTGHRAARLDAGRLARRVAEWERDPAVRQGLNVVMNGLCFVRGGRLVLPFAPAGPGVTPAPSPTATLQGRAADDHPTSRTLRYTAAVRAVAETAVRPVRCGELVRKVEARFPGVPEGAVTADHTADRNTGRARPARRRNPDHPPWSCPHHSRPRRQPRATGLSGPPADTRVCPRDRRPAVGATGARPWPGHRAQQPQQRSPETQAADRTLNPGRDQARGGHSGHACSPFSPTAYRVAGTGPCGRSES